MTQKHPARSRRKGLVVALAVVLIGAGAGVGALYWSQTTPLEGVWIAPSGKSAFHVERGWFGYQVTQERLADDFMYYEVLTPELRDGALRFESVIHFKRGTPRTVHYALRAGPEPDTLYVDDYTNRDNKCWACNHRNHGRCFGVADVWCRSIDQTSQRGDDTPIRAPMRACKCPCRGLR